ncbi:hypothetical protein BH09BAC2_BH09BAC2_20110 [soil metagenome]
MKKILIIVLSVLIYNGAFAQLKINRSKAPAADPAPVLSLANPVTFKLPNGITVFVVEDHKLPTVSASYYVDYGPVKEGAKAGALQMMGRMLNEGTTQMTKAAFDEAVGRMGADVSLSANGGNVSALTRYFPKAFDLMAQAILKPAFTQESLDKLRTQAITGLKADERNAKAISSRVVSALSFGMDHPSGEFKTEETYKAITLQDIKIYYTKYISPSRGFLTIVGDIKPAAAKALALKAFANWKGTAISIPSIADVNGVAKTEIDFVDVPTASQAEITVTNLVRIPLNSPDYFPALIANYILGGGAEAKLFMNLREKHGFTYGAYSGVGTGRFQSTFSATAAVRNEKVDSAVAEILSEIANIRSKTVTAEELKNAKAVYAGNYALSLENKSLTAAFARNIIINNLPQDFYKTYLQKINAVTATDVQRVAAKYFNHDNTRVVIVGKGSVIEPGLTRLGYTVNKFDKYAKPVSASSSANVNSTINTQVTAPPQKLTAEGIINNYLNAAGGIVELKKINSLVTTGTMTIGPTSLEITKKEMNPNLQLMEMSMNGMQAIKQVFNGSKGYMVQMGNKRDLGADEIQQKQHIKGLFPQLFYNDGTYTLANDGTQIINGKEAYRVSITSASGDKSTEYYDVNSGLLVKEEKTIKSQGQEIAQVVEYSNYKKAGNVMLPYSQSIVATTTMGQQEFAIEVSDIKINEGVKVEDFK